MNLTDQANLPETRIVFNFGPGAATKTKRTIEVRDGDELLYSDELNIGVAASRCKLAKAIANKRPDAGTAEQHEARILQLLQSTQPHSQGCESGETIGKLTVKPGRPSRGIFPVSILHDNVVLLTAKVNPHKQGDIDSLIARISTEIQGVEEQSGEIRSELLQLAIHESAESAPTGTGGYSTDDDGHWFSRTVGDTEVGVKLTNFKATILAEVVRDDGVERVNQLEIEARQAGRATIFTISGSDFSTMKWPVTQVGPEAIIYAGRGMADHAKVAIQEHAIATHEGKIPRRVVYAHTGWREVESGWVYLHAGGAIGENGMVDGIDVSLSEKLAKYTLPSPSTGDDLKSAVSASIGLLDLGADAIMFPVFCAVWRAAIGSCDFSLHLAGSTGVYKSQVAALAQQFFGAGMDSANFPASWISTDNAIEGLLFAAKDTLTVVDDFNPCGGPNEVARLHQKADRIFRAQGNNAGRDRMRADGTLRPSKPPRGLTLSTGEDIPAGHSCRARMLVIEVAKGDLKVDVLTRLQSDASNGRYADAMAGYVQWLARHPEHREGLRSDIVSLRQEAGIGHSRTPEIVANLLLGLRRFLGFAIESGALERSGALLLWNRGKAAIQRTADKQSAYHTASEPAQRFVELLESAISTGLAHLSDTEGKPPLQANSWGWRLREGGQISVTEPTGDHVGWVDGSDVLLDPCAAYRAVLKMASHGNEGLKVTEGTLLKRLNEKGLLIKPKSDELLHRRKLQDKPRKVILLAPGILSPEPLESPV